LLTEVLLVLKKSQAKAMLRHLLR